ncbi:Phytanoyl-CoA dioxygenase [Sphingomonas antarctica]|uniref:hypothetical protein n=1 Tax=Sphingomonas antarctica TaxID=2040274 RepID=UPI0039EBED5C
MTVTAADYGVQPAPATVKPIDATFVWRSDLIDYTRHRAYGDLVRTAGIGQRVSALASYAGRFALLAAKRVIRYEMIPSEYRTGTSLSHRLGFAGMAARNAIGLGRKTSRRSDLAANAVIGQLDQQGVAVLTMPPGRVADLLALAAPYFEQLEARRGSKAAGRKFDDSRFTTDRTASPDLFAMIETVFDESGLRAAATAYLGRPARLIDVNPQINDRSDSFWRDIFDDLNEGTLPKTAYYHRDASGGDLKVIIYCTDVGPTNGPFSYAVGSNNMVISRIDDLLCEANDHNGLSATDLAARRRFAALPPKLRQKGSFGNDLPDDQPESGRIVGSTWDITGPKGSIVAFDTKGIHRGGMVEEGERRVLTCVLG